MAVSTIGKTRVGEKVLVSKDISHGILSSSGLAMAVVKRFDNDFVDLEFADGTSTAVPATVFKSSIAV